MKAFASAASPGLSTISPALLTFRTSSGAPHVLAAAWVGVICSRPAVLSITLKRSISFPERRPLAGEFAINLPSEEQMASPSFLGLLAQEESNSFPGSLTLGAGVATGAPVVPECPVRIECRGATLFSRFGQEIVSGEVAAVHMEGRIYGLEGPIDFCRLRPFDGPLAAARKTGFEGIIPPGMEAGLFGGAPS